MQIFTNRSVLVGIGLLCMLASPSVFGQPATTSAAPPPPDAPAASMSANAGVEYPAPDDFTDATEPTCDLVDLQRRLEYPERARRRDIEGKVIVRVLVDKDGTPVRSFIDYTDHDLLSEAAQHAVMQTPFTPGEQHGKPVPVWVSVPVVFRLK